MAKEKQNSEKEEEEMKKIPVFTVLKNGSILKNIFLLENPLPLSSDDGSIKRGNSPSSISDSEEWEEEQKVENLIVGRHPNCNIVLEHPSISRFHLRVLLKPSSQKLSVIDLSSVHGTWVLDKKIEPEVLIDLDEGDTMRLGSSTRVYRLHWVPLNRVFNVDNPFIFSDLENPLPISANIENVEEISFEREQEQIYPSFQMLETSPDFENPLPFEEKDEINENENPISFLRELKQIPTAPPMPQNTSSSFTDEEEEEETEALVFNEKENLNPILIGEGQNPLRGLEQWSDYLVSELVNSSNLPVQLGIPVTQQIDKETQNPQALVALDLLSQVDNQFSPFRKSESKTSGAKSIWTRSGKSPANRHVDKENQNSQALIAKDLLSDLENLESPTRKSEQQSDAKSIWSRRCKSPANQQFDKENQNPQDLIPKDLLYELENFESPPRKSEQKSKAKSIRLRRGKSPAYYQQFNKENLSPQVLVAMASDSGNSLAKLDVDRVPLETIKQQFYKENQNPQALDAMYVLSELDNQDSPPRKSEQKSDTPSIWSRRGKSASMIQIQTGRSRAKGIEEVGTNAMEGALVPKILFSGQDHDDEEEMFTPDKENFTPKPVFSSKSMKKGRLEEIKNKNCSGSLSSKVVSSPNLGREGGLFNSADKENMTPLSLRESNSKKSASGSRARLEPEMIMMRRRAGRVPFQSLLPNSPSKSKPEFWITSSNTTRSSYSVSCSQTIEKNCISSPLSLQDQYSGELTSRRWNMVVDTSCLLNKDSWKSLKLLQGLKGTHLIIPRMVIRELDCLKRRGSIFRRTTEVSLVLEWIEECMVKTNWWIHVQNSFEESMPIAPTPPASPRPLLNQGSSSTSLARSVPFSSCGSLMEIATPTAQDHILDCALFFKRIKNDEQLVLLSNDVSLKIKAMAEGLICETAEDFRDSLVNPFSGRFLWSESTPRGSTWSSFDEAASLRENYYQFAVKKKTSKGYGEGAKGLKLILLHNSQYRQMSPVN